MCTRLLLAILLMPLTSHALDFQHRDTVVLADIIAVPDGRLGWTVGISQGGVFVGAPFLTKPDGPSQGGATYLYQIDDQRQLDFVQELVPQDPRPARYGEAIVTDGEIAAIGYGSRDLVEIYLQNGANWALSKVIETPTIDGVTVRGFGQFMDLEGDLLVVGDHTANVGADSNAGVVMIFGRNTGGANNWGLITHLLDPNPPESAEFAKSVAISDDLVVVGDAPNDRALLYRRIDNVWEFDKNLQPQDMEVDDSFGISVEAEGDTIAVGALNGNEAELPTNSGSVHIFHRNQGGSNNFGQLTQIYPSAPAFIDRFGESMRLREGLLVVGAPGAQQVYVFARFTGAWLEEQLVTPPDDQDFNNAEFGFDVDYQRGSLMVGSNRWPDIEGVRDGAIFLYEDWGTVLCGALNAIYCDGFEDKDPGGL
jgi:hypothetical protein